MARQSIPLKNPYLAALLAWLVPGLGHLYQGRRGKAILYFVCILGLYFAGLAMGEAKIVYWRWLNPLKNPEDFRWYYLAQFWTGLVALPGLIQASLAYYGKAPIFGGFLAEPAMHVINGLHRTHGRFVDIGSVYTVIAGLLNILAIYDAYEGPALAEEPESAMNEASNSTEATKPPPLLLEPGT